MVGANILSILLCASVFLLTFSTLWQLVVFLSSQNNTFGEAYAESTSDVVWSLVVDWALLCMFILQHSVMAHPQFKKYLYSTGLHVLERSVYLGALSVTLKFFMYAWHPIPSICLWEVDTTNSALSWLFFTTVHALAWFIIYGGSIMMDFGELMGVKQVYYHIQGMPDPLMLKSIELQRFYSHMRHPSFTGFLMILWVFPSMRLDRILLATGISLYMYLAWNLDRRDYVYQKQQLQKKKLEIQSTY